MSGAWESRKLGTAVTLVMGQAPAARDCNKDGRGTPFVKVGEFGAERPVIREWTTDPKKMARETDVLICVVGATCGKINLGIDCAIGRSAAAIRPRPEKLDQRYLWYFMQGKVLEMRAGSRGAAQTVISREMINGIDISLPPLEEQRRIVAVLDEAFASIGTATANTEKNLANARELLLGYLNSVLSDSSASGEMSGWGNGPLGELCEILDRLRKPITKSDRRPGKYPYYGATGIVDYVDGYIFDEELVLLGEDGAKWGPGERSAFTASGKYWVNNHAHIMRPNRKLLSDEWLVYYLNMADLTPYITGVTVPKLNQERMRSIPIPLPPLEIQNLLVTKMDVLSEEVRGLRAVNERKLEALSLLKQSLLASAFSDELIREEALAA